MQNSSLRAQVAAAKSVPSPSARHQRRSWQDIGYLDLIKPPDIEEWQHLAALGGSSEGWQHLELREDAIRAATVHWIR